MTKADKLDLIAELYQTFLDATTSFENYVGENLAYLMGAIALDSNLDVHKEESGIFVDPGMNLFLSLLRTYFSPGHEVWSFINVVKAE